MEEIFTQIYRNRAWDLEKEGKGTSGLGSTLANCLCYIQFLEIFLKFNLIETIVDLGCGDWSFSQHIQWGNRRYLGIDIVKNIVEENQKKFASPAISFLHADALRMELPSADLLLCKDVLMHLPNQEITDLAKQFGKFKHCLITNSIDHEINRDIPAGGVRPLDLTEAPFHLEGTKALTYHTDHCTKQVLHIRKGRYP